MSDDPKGENTYHSRKTRSVTFRLNSKIIDDLQTEANARHVSFSVLVNQILERYAEWDRYENKMDMMPVPKVILSSLIDRPISIAKSSGIKDVDHYQREIIKHAAELAFSLMKDSILLIKKQYNLEILLSVLKEYLEVSGIKADHKIEGSQKHIFMIQHNLGENWSLFTKELLTLIFEKLANAKAEINMTSNTIVAEVLLRQ